MVEPQSRSRLSFLHRWRAALLFLATALVLVTARCGGSESSEPTTSDGSGAEQVVAGASQVQIEPLPAREADDSCPFTAEEISQLLGLSVAQNDRGGNACEFEDPAEQVNLWMDWNDASESPLQNSRDELTATGGQLQERPQWGEGGAVVISPSGEVQAILISGSWKLFIGLRPGGTATEQAIAQVDALGDALSS